jgi:transcriptional activator SPT8
MGKSFYGRLTGAYQKNSGPDSLPTSPETPTTIRSPILNSHQESDNKSDTSFDPLFDDEQDAEPDENGTALPNSHPETMFDVPNSSLAMPVSHLTTTPTIKPISVFCSTQKRSISARWAAYSMFSSDILMTASIDGQVILWDKRARSSGDSARNGGGGVGRLWMSEKNTTVVLVGEFLHRLPTFVNARAFQACWSADGGQIYAGRRNGTVDIWDVRQLGSVDQEELRDY